MTELNQARVQSAVEPIWHWVDWTLERLNVLLSNGDDVEVSVRPERDAAIDVARFGTSWTVEVVSGSRAAREWAALNEMALVEMWEGEVRRD